MMLPDVVITVWVRLLRLFPLQRWETLSFWLTPKYTEGQH